MYYVLVDQFALWLKLVHSSVLSSLPYIYIYKRQYNKQLEPYNILVGCTF